MAQNLDLFEYIENQPDNLRLIYDKYEERIINGLSYLEISQFLKEVNEIGFTFDSYLDGEIYGLRPIGVEINQLVGFENI